MPGVTGVPYCRLGKPTGKPLGQKDRMLTHQVSTWHTTTFIPPAVTPGDRLKESSKENIALLMSCEASAKDVADQFKCFMASAYRLQQNVELYGSPQPPGFHPIGRPPRLNAKARDAMIKWMLENTNEHKMSYLDEICEFLMEEFQISMHKSTVSRELKKLDILNKKVALPSFLCRSYSEVSTMVAEDALPSSVPVRPYISRLLEEKAIGN